MISLWVSQNVMCKPTNGEDLQQYMTVSSPIPVNFLHTIYIINITLFQYQPGLFNPQDECYYFLWNIVTLQNNTVSS
jgi:hypothetical protein